MTEASRYRVTLTWPRTGKWFPREDGYLPHLICPLGQRSGGSSVEAKVADHIASFIGKSVKVARLEQRARTVKLALLVPGTTRHPKPHSYVDYRCGAQSAVDLAVEAAVWLEQGVNGESALPEPVRIQVFAALPATEEG